MGLYIPAKIIWSWVLKDFILADFQTANIRKSGQLCKNFTIQIESFNKFPVFLFLRIRWDCAAFTLFASWIDQYARANGRSYEFAFEDVCSKLNVLEKPCLAFYEEFGLYVAEAFRTGNSPDNVVRKIYIIPEIKITYLFAISIIWYDLN